MNPDESVTGTLLAKRCDLVDGFWHQWMGAASRGAQIAQQGYSPR
jgi:hypothetical protein